MAFTFAAFCYMLALLLTAALIFFAIWHVSTHLRSANPKPTVVGEGEREREGGRGKGWLISHHKANARPARQQPQPRNAFGLAPSKLC